MEVTNEELKEYFTKLVNESNPLYGKTFCFLGSSVTYGVDNVSFVDFIQKNNGCKCIKEAVPGTTLTNIDEQSYVRRLINNIDKSVKIDHFICQLSTNDTGKKLALGEISTSYDINDFNTTTIVGAIEYIIAYAMKTWQCPVSFFTGTKYDCDEYAAMVDALYKLKEKWSIGLIDLWSNSGISNMVNEVLEKYMLDYIHPSVYGYEKWWTPIFEDHLKRF